MSTETQSRVERYLARVDAHLRNNLTTTLERKQFLEGNVNWWEAAHRYFILTNGASMPSAVLPELTLTIAGLKTRYETVGISGSVECPHCKWGFAPRVINQHIREKHGSAVS